MLHLLSDCMTLHLIFAHFGFTLFERLDWCHGCLVTVAQQYL